MNDKKKEEEIKALQEFKEESFDLPSLIEFAHEKGGFSVVPTKEGNDKTKAMVALKGQTQNELDSIFEQMKVLANEAKKIKERVGISNLLHETKFSFAPIQGEEYYFYQKDNGDYTLSLISPKEWKNSSLIFIAKVRLLADDTWEILETEIKEEPAD